MKISFVKIVRRPDLKMRATDEQRTLQLNKHIYLL